MTFRIEITERALADRNRCFDFICERSPVGALNWLDAFETAVATLLKNPHFGIAPESANSPESIRQKVFRTPQGHQYRLLYVIRKALIVVIHVRGTGQDVMVSNEILLPPDSDAPPEDHA